MINPHANTSEAGFFCSLLLVKGCNMVDLGYRLTLVERLILSFVKAKYLAQRSQGEFKQAILGNMLFPKEKIKWFILSCAPLLRFKCLSNITFLQTCVMVT